MKTVILFSILMISSLCYANIDCENAVTNNDLIICLQQKKKLKEHYITSKSILFKTCKSMFEGSRLKSMYVNYCIAEQLDILSKSQKIFICAQQDADGREEHNQSDKVSISKLEKD